VFLIASSNPESRRQIRQDTWLHIACSFCCLERRCITFERSVIIVSYFGYSLYVQIFNPINSEQTSVKSRTIGVKYGQSTEIGKKMIKKTSKNHEFERKAFK
jgi:hypothetical protein